MNKWIPMCFFMLIVLFSIPLKVDSHAYLDRSTPIQESELSESPSEIRVTFTEPINTTVSKLTLKKENGDVIEGVQSADDNLSLVLAIPELQDGIYHVYWQVLALDTHITDGSFRFSVGVELPPHRPADSISLDELLEEQEIEQNTAFNWNRFLRIIDVVLITSVTGLFYFVHWVIGGMPKSPLQKRIVLPFLISVMILFCLTGFGHLFIRGAEFTQGAWNNLELWKMIGTLSTSTIIGAVAFIRPFLIGILLFHFSKSSSKWIPSVSIIGLLLTFPLTGHALQYNMIISHFFHLLAASIWFGGLVGLVIYSFKVQPTENRIFDFHTLIKKFSIIALIMVFIITLTGIILSLAYVESWDTFIVHEYSSALIWKLVFFTIALLIAGFHRFLLLPKLLSRKYNNTFAPSTLLWAIRVELVAALVVMIFAGVLSTTSPPVNSHEEQNYHEHEHDHHNH